MGRKLFNGNNIYTYQNRSYTIAGLDDLELLEQVLSSNNLTYSNPISPSAVNGTVSTVQLPVEYQSLFIACIIVQGMVYSIGASLNEANKVCTYNSATRTITFPTPLWSTINVWYKGIQGDTPTSSVITVDTYEQMVAASTGNKVLKIFVNQASQYNDAGEFFDYIPSKGIAYLGIDFNYTQ